MERWVGKVAVVTGASAGIGLETAKALVQHGMIVVGLARRVDTVQERMNEVSGPGKFYANACDVTDENQVISVFEWIEKNLESVHVLVNNAGSFTIGSISDMKTKDMVNTINVNLIGLLHCTRKAIKIMKQNDHEAHIINVNSISGHMVPKYSGMNIYPATKYGVTAVSTALIHEIRGKKTKMTSVSPGIVKTELLEYSGYDDSYYHDKLALDPKDVADCIVFVVSAPRHVQIIELMMNSMDKL